MRIALLGPAGSGKSTLASALAEDLKLTVPDEDMAALVHHHHAFQMARNLSLAMGPANAKAIRSGSTRRCVSGSKAMRRGTQDARRFAGTALILWRIAGKPIILAN
jgi:cytidylate kinase